MNGADMSGAETSGTGMSGAGLSGVRLPDGTDPAGAPVPPTPSRAVAPRLPAEVEAILRSTMLWVVWGVAMAVMALNVPVWDSVTVGNTTALVVCGVAAALAAIPYTGRQIIVTSHLHNTIVIHRNTLLPAGFVAAIAGSRPKAAWEIPVDAALLIGYLLLLDLLTVPVPALKRLAGPVFLLTGAGVTAAALALVALPGTDSSLRTGVAAVAGASLLGTAMATGFRIAETRRVGSRGTEPPKTDRSPR